MLNWCNSDAGLSLMGALGIRVRMKLRENHRNMGWKERQFIEFVYTTAEYLLTIRRTLRRHLQSVVHPQNRPFWKSGGRILLSIRRFKEVCRAVSR